MSERVLAVRPAKEIALLQAYRVPTHGAPIDLYLAGNEGTPRDANCLPQLADPELFRRYPDVDALEAEIAKTHGVTADRVLVCAGADDALARAIRSVAAPDRAVILPIPTFEMLDRYVVLSGCDLKTVRWDTGQYPCSEVISLVDSNTAAIVVVSPNNPTGAIATADDVTKLCRAAPGALIVIDQAYGEYADVDLVPVATRHPNAVIMKTMSKAWGLAGLRIGYVIGEPEILRWMRAVGQPYAVSSLSVAAARKALKDDRDWVRDRVAQVRKEREALHALLDELGQRPRQSSANFVLAEFDDALWVRDALSGLGIAIRNFPGRPELNQCLRISCPGNDQQYERLDAALRAALAPQALLFDMDGVLADTSHSYREAVVRTAASFGVEVTREDVTREKMAGDANDDWLLTQRMVSDRGRSVSYDDIVARFEEHYQGRDGAEGLWRSEQLLVKVETLQALSAQYKLAIVTGRPRSDALRFLRMFDLERLFSVVVCREDADLKPSPSPVRRALEDLAVAHAWMFGDTPDDLVAARLAGVVPVGVLAPGDVSELADTLDKNENSSGDAVCSALISAGASRVFPNIEEALELAK